MKRVSDTPHLLYVSWNFPPARSPGVYRTLATANYFARSGWRVTVLTADRETFINRTGIDSSLEEAIDPRISIVRLPFHWPATESPTIRRLPMGSLLERLWIKINWIAHQLPYPEVRYGAWAIPLRRAAEEIQSRNPVDLVVASAAPNVDFYPALYLNRKHGIPFVADYRDAWILNLKTGEQAYPDSSRQARIESQIMERAREVWFVNQPILEWHRQRYPMYRDRMHLVANGFDPEYAPKPQDATSDAEGGLVFGYIGSLYHNPPLAEFVAGWRVAEQLRPDMFSNSTTEIWGHYGLLGRRNRSDPIPELEGVEHISFKGPLRKAEVAAKYEEFDVLVLILAGGPYITGGKTYEYMASSLPIVSVHQTDNHTAAELEGYPLWFAAADLTPTGIAHALIEAAEAALTASTEVRERCRNYASKFDRLRQLEPRITALREFVSGERD